MKNVSFVHSPWPDCVVQMMSYDDCAPDLPGTHGSGFFVHHMGDIFLLTARHCLGKIGDDLASRAGRLMIPKVISETPRVYTQEDYVNFRSVNRGKVEGGNKDLFVGDGEGDLDVVALDATPSASEDWVALCRRSVQLPPSGQWFQNIAERHLAKGDDLVVLVRGFPKRGTDSDIDYEERRVVMQGVTLRAKLTGVGPYPHTLSVRFFDDVPISDGDGLSGGPVYLQVQRGCYALAGMVLNGTFPIAHFATVPWLTEAVQKCAEFPISLPGSP